MEKQLLEDDITTQPSNGSLRVAYLTSQDPFDKRSWSSGLYHIGQALEQHCGDVTYLGPLRPYKPTFLSRVLTRISLILFRKSTPYFTSIAAARHYSREATQKLAGQAFDIIVAGICGAAIAYLETDIPILLVNDCTVTQLIDYYPYYTHLSRRAIREICAIEEQVYKKVRASIMSSEWAARSAIEDYHVKPEHVYVVPLGANFDTVPDRGIADARKPSGICKLLFIGVEWERKGGDIVYETLLRLEEMGIEAELIICGCVPPVGMTHPRITVIPFLDKNDERQAREIEKLYIMSDFLFLPTRADCTPFVFNEANAFGLPVITTATGGIASVIYNGENGYILPLAARGDSYADVIAAIHQDLQRYLRLVQSSRAAFEERLNWDVWGRHVHDILVKESKKVEILQEHG